MSTLNYIDENGNINKAGVIPKNYPATNVSYDNSQSGLSATKVQGAIDEVAGQIARKVPIKDISSVDILGSFVSEQTSIVFQRYDDSTIRIIFYLHDAQDTRYICHFSSCTKITN